MIENHAYDQSLLGEEKPHQDEILEEDDRPSWQIENGGGVEEEPKVSDMTLPTLRSIKKP